MNLSRRGWLRGALTATVGVSVGIGAMKMPGLLQGDRLPMDGGYAPAGNSLTWSDRGGVRTVWHVPTDKPWVALTFDDGPERDWTPRVLDILDAAKAPATFYVVGDRLVRNADLIRGRYDRHEVGNHTWQHKDLAKRDETSVRNQLTRCHEAIIAVTGRKPTSMRPPWGHLGGTTLTVADEFDYDVVMWSYVMPEKQFDANRPGIVGDVVANARPGAILLAHDVGRSSRLIVIDQLAPMIKGLRDKGLELVTVSQLLSASTRRS